MRALPPIIGFLVVSGCCDEGLTKPRDIDIEVGAALRAIEANGSEYLLVDEAGRVLVLEQVAGQDTDDLAVSREIQLGAAPLVDVVAGPSSIWVVGEGGAAFESVDHGQTWTSLPLEAGLEPAGVLLVSDFVIVYGEDFVRTRHALFDIEWLEPELLAGGSWGSLRAGVLGSYEQVALSDGSSLLLGRQPSATEPPVFGQRVDAPTEVVTLGYADVDRYVVGGRDGVAMSTIAGETQDWTELTWVDLELPSVGDVVAIDHDWVLTSTGELIGLSTHADLDVGRASAGLASGEAGLVVFGANGPIVVTQYHDCPPKP